MKKIFIILCCMLCMSAHATEMCARNDTVVIPLDATIRTPESKTNYNSTEYLWWVSFDYGTIYGSVSCLSLKEIQEIQNNPNLATPPAVLNTSSDEIIGASGYYMNADTNPDIPDSEKPKYERVYCLSKITHPMSSNWVWRNKWDHAYCKHQCVIDTKLHVASNQGWLEHVFKSIGTTPPWEWEDE